MDLLDEIRAEVKPRGGKCGTRTLLASLDETTRDAVIRACGEGLYDATATWLGKREISITAGRLRYHFAGQCQCRTR